MNRAPIRVRWSSVVAGTLLLGLVPLADARGQFVSPRIGIRTAQATNRHGNAGMYRHMNGAGVGNYYRMANNNARQINHQLVSELRGTVALLHQADHDYNGHRVQAIRHLSMAVHALNPNAGQGNGAANRVGLGNGAGNTAGLAKGTGKGKGQANKMPQAMSDQHLQQALQRLTVIQNQVSNVGSNQHHAQALGHVQNAAQELRTALSIK